MIKVECLAVGGLIIPSRVGSTVNDQICRRRICNCSSQLEKQQLIIIMMPDDALMNEKQEKFV
jgi:hypothetical protein